MSSVRIWISAFRLRTLPLALSSIIVGSVLAYKLGKFNPVVAILAALTTLFLQILSNLANDYGDFKHGVDNDERIGPQRAMQSGAIGQRQMKTALIVFVALALISGILLIWEGTKDLHWSVSVSFFALGIIAIAAAIKYTVGKNPYGYWGMGDFFVFLFFGIVGVLGTYLLQTHEFELIAALPAISIGLLATSVLNLNNMRDRTHDQEVGKKTFAVILGESKSKYYHGFLIVVAALTAMAYAFASFENYIEFLALVIFIPIANNLRTVWNNEIPAHLDPELKKIALLTLIYALLLALTSIIAAL